MRKIGGQKLQRSRAVYLARQIGSLPASGAAKFRRPAGRRFLERVLAMGAPSADRLAIAFRHLTKVVTKVAEDKMDDAARGVRADSTPSRDLAAR